MNEVTERFLDLKSLRAAWNDLNKIVPLGPIKSERDYERRVRVMEELLDRIGADEAHALMPLFDLIATQVQTYETSNHCLPDASPGLVLRYLMDEHQLKQTDLAEELGGQSIVSAILNGKRELNARQVKALAQRFKVSPAVFL